MRAQSTALLLAVDKEVQEIEAEEARRAAEEERIRQAEEAEREALRLAEAARIALVQRARRIQQQLRRSGRCSAGYEWIASPEHPVYRCGGGSHWCRIEEYQ